MAGIELDRVATPSCSFGGEKGRAAAAKGIENDVAALRDIENRVADHSDAFDG